MLKATLIDKEPKIKSNKSFKEAKISISEINSAIEHLDLKYKRIDELDIFNIISYILSKKKGS